MANYTEYCYICPEREPSHLKVPFVRRRDWDAIIKWEEQNITYPDYNREFVVPSPCVLPPDPTGPAWQFDDPESKACSQQTRVNENRTGKLNLSCLRNLRLSPM